MAKRKGAEENGKGGNRLRKAAEEKIAQSPKPSQETDGLSAERILHELQIHQVELEMQNEELRRSQLALEVSRDKYLDLYDFAPIGYFTLTLKGKVMEANLAGAALLGVDRQRLIQKPLAAFVVLEDITRWDKYLRKIVQDGNAGSCDLQLRKDDGSTIDAHFNGIRMEGNDGVQTVRVAVSDTSELMLAEKALQESENRFRALAESSPVGVYLTNNRGNFVYVNQSWCEMTGLSQEGGLGKGWAKGLHPEDRASVEAEWYRTVASGRTWSAELRFEDHRGNVTRIQSNAAPIYDLDGRVSGYVGVYVDITERKRAEEALGEANRKLQLMTGITRHDILNELIVLRGNLELAKTSKDPNAVEKFENNTIQAARNIETMIRFTKDYQEIGLKEPSWQNIRRIVNTMASNVTFAGLKLENLLPEIDVSTDPLLVRVFANMIDDTVRHGERATFIRFRSQVEDGTLQIIYEDDGVGIQSEEKKKIFERGYGKNSGFGLFFAREILAITGSTIEENGEWGKGARFEIRVPSGKYRMMESASSE